MAQEFLNASPDHTWAMVSNGRQLRLLRDAATLTRPSFLEIDLQDLLGGARYAEFANVWRLLHASRAPQPALHPESGEQEVPCIWEQWRAAGQEEGTRVREGLRQGVTEALLIFGEGFIQHPANEALRAAMAVALSSARSAYAEGYAVARLRDLCLKRRARNRFDDHWQALRIVFKGLAEGDRLARPRRPVCRKPVPGAGHRQPRQRPPARPPCNTCAGPTTAAAWPRWTTAIWVPKNWAASTKACWNWCPTLISSRASSASSAWAIAKAAPLATRANLPAATTRPTRWCRNSSVPPSTLSSNNAWPPAPRSRSRRCSPSASSTPPAAAAIFCWPPRAVWPNNSRNCAHPMAQYSRKTTATPCAKSSPAAFSGWTAIPWPSNWRAPLYGWKVLRKAPLELS
ncbi:hypothetical protein AFERRI_560026 [Acidithiobacillus ferrivorans]|uniref:Uncharacterized protein n=1 Tax=Acidithiobacillus ferrivorans TaxID=160808 RepID=A0A060USC4_9PROT|nr:hypothetical protein AFERRI_560026 [Acidithiobacillus ferrivorans]